MNRVIAVLAFFCFISSGEAQWTYVREVSINNLGAQGSNAVILVSLTSSNFDFAKSKTDGADVRFSTTKGNFSGAGLNYWIEQWNVTGLSKIWVKVPTLAANATTKIYLYYGNTTANAVQNGDSTFLFFDDFEGVSWSNKWENPPDAGDGIANVTEQSGMLKLNEENGQEGKLLAKNFQVTGKMIIRSLYSRGGGEGDWVCAGIGGWGYWCTFGDFTTSAHGSPNWVMIRDSMLGTSNTPLITAPNGNITAGWRPISLLYDGSKLIGKEDSVEVEWPVSNPGTANLGVRTLDNDAPDNFAFITVSPYTGADPAVTIGTEATVATGLVLMPLSRKTEAGASVQRLVAKGGKVYSLNGTLSKRNINRAGLYVVKLNGLASRTLLGMAK